MTPLMLSVFTGSVELLDYSALECLLRQDFAVILLDVNMPGMDGFETAEIIRLSVEDQRRFVEAILNPPEPTPALRRAFQRHRKLFGIE